MGNIDKAYEFKIKNNYLVSEDIGKEIGGMNKKYEKMRSGDFIDEKLKKNMMDILKSKLGENIRSMNGKGLDINYELKVHTSKSEDTLIITLDWGRKCTGGYLLRIIEAKEVDKNTIEVTYYAKKPGEKDIVTQVITYPKDTIQIKVENINSEYNIILKPKLK